MIKVTVCQHETPDGRESDDNASVRSSDDAVSNSSVNDRPMVMRVNDDQQCDELSTTVDEVSAVEQLLIKAKKAGNHHRMNDLVPTFSGTVKQVCDHRSHARCVSA